MKDMLSGSVEKMVGRMFRRVDSVVWDLMSGKLGVRTRDGEIATIEGEGDDASIVLNPFDDFGVAIPAFAQATPIEAVKVGDLIYTNGEAPGWIISMKTSEAGKKTFRVIRPGGNVSSWVPPKVSLLGFDSGVLVVRNLLNILPQGTDGTSTNALAGLQGTLLPMLALGGGDIDLEKMLPLMLMSQASGGAAGNPMGGLMQMMLMSKLMGESGGGLFGSSRKTPFRG